MARTEPILTNHPPGPHPTPEQLYRARRGPRTTEAERWLAHTAACAVCTEELLRQEAFDAPGPVSARRLDAAWERFSDPTARASMAPIPPPAPSSASRPSRAPLAPIVQLVPPATRPAGRPGIPRAALGLAAALLAAALGFGIWTSAHQPVTRATLRGGTEQAGTWEPTGLLDTPPVEFVFPAVAGEPQRVSVFNGKRSYTWTSKPVAGGRILFPEAERRRLQPGADYYWTVIDDEGGGTIAKKFVVR